MVEAGERLGAGWSAVSQGVGEEVAGWRRAHPRATLTEIEQEVEAATRGLTRWLVEELAGEETAGREERPQCPRCRTAMERRGHRVREVLVAHQPQAVRLERAAFVCPACHAGLSPWMRRWVWCLAVSAPNCWKGWSGWGAACPSLRWRRNWRSSGASR